MRLSDRDKRTAHIRRASYEADNAYHEPTTRWGAPAAIRAAVRPAAAGLDAQVYGTDTATMRMMHYSGPADIAPKDGVCLDVPGDAAPDWRVEAVETFRGFRRVTLRFVPESKREADM
jgi:hypothetical protein